MEIEKARELGYHIEVKEGLYFESADFLFTDYFSALLKQKAVAEAEGRRDAAFIAKITVNALTGRFGKKPIRKKTIIVHRDELDRQVCDQTIIRHTVRTISPETNYVLATVMGTTAPVNERTYLTESAVQISAFITATARVWLYELLSFPGVRPLYVDTDACLFEKTDPAVTTDKINEHLTKKFNMSNDLPVGRLHPVHPGGVIKEAVILAQKLYTVVYEPAASDQCPKPEPVQAFAARGVRLKQKERPASADTISF